MRDAATIKPNPTQPVGQPNPRARAALSFSFEGQGGGHASKWGRGPTQNRAWSVSGIGELK